MKSKYLMEKIKATSFILWCSFLHVVIMHPINRVPYDELLIDRQAHRASSFCDLRLGPSKVVEHFTKYTISFLPLDLIINCACCHQFLSWISRWQLPTLIFIFFLLSFILFVLPRPSPAYTHNFLFKHSFFLFLLLFLLVLLSLLLFFYVLVLINRSSIYLCVFGELI